MLGGGGGGGQTFVTCVRLVHQLYLTFPKITTLSWECLPYMTCTGVCPDVHPHMFTNVLCVAMVTLGRAALPVLWEFLRMYPTPERAMRGDQREMAALLTPLGLHTKRAGIIARMSGDPMGGDCCQGSR